MPKSYALVVCGASTPSDYWFFANMIGVRAYLSILGIDAIYHNCFPLAKYWASEKVRVAGWTDIKYGYTNANDTRRNYVANYTKFSYEHRPLWFKDWPDKSDHRQFKATLKTDILNIRQALQTGDSFTLVLMSHGNTEGIELMGRICTYELIDEWLGRNRGNQPNPLPIPSGVHINAIISSCHSGAFNELLKASLNEERTLFAHTSSKADQNSYASRANALAASRRSRGSVFMLHTLAGLGLTKTLDGWTVEAQIEYIAAELAKTNQLEKYDEPQESDAFVSDPSIVLSAFAATLFSDFDVSSFVTTENTSQRVLAEVDYNVLLARYKNVVLSRESVEEAFKFIGREIEHVNGTHDGRVPLGGRGEHRLLESDASIYHAYNEVYPLWEAGIITPAQCSPGLADAIGEINLRFEYQSIMASIVGDLCRSGALSPDCVKHPISWTDLRRDSVTQPSARIYKMLCMFDLPKIFARAFRDKDYNLFDTPIEWLALMITRGTTSIAAVHKCLVLSKKLGSFDEAKLMRNDPTLFELHLGLGDAELHSDNFYNLSPRIGWVLPSDVDGDQEILAWKLSYEYRMERARKLFVLAFGETAPEHDEIYANVGLHRTASVSSFGSLGL